MAAKRLKLGLLDLAQTVLLALAGKQRLLLAAVPPEVLERTELAAIQVLGRTQPLLVLVLVLVERAVVHLK